MLWLLVAAAVGPLPDNAIQPTPQQVQALVDSYGQCIVKKEHDAASAAIVSDPADGELTRRFPQLIQGNCVSMKLGDYISMRFTPTQMRDVIAEKLVQRDLASVPPPVLDDVPPLSHWAAGEPPALDARGKPLGGRKAEEATAAYEQAKLAAYLSRFGECVVRVDPAGSKALLMTDQGSAQEQAAFGGLATALGTCLAEGRTLNFNKASLRGSIAVNYYRLALAARNIPAKITAGSRN